MARHGVRNVFLPPTALQADAAGRRAARAVRLELRSIASGGEALGDEMLDWAQRDVRRRRSTSSTARPSAIWWSAIAPRSSRCGPARWAGRYPGHGSRWSMSTGKTMPAGETGIIAVRAARPGDVPRLLEQSGGDARPSSPATGADRRRRAAGCRRLHLVPGPRGRRHHQRRLPHRPGRHRGLPDEHPAVAMAAVVGSPIRCGRKS